MRLSTRHAAEHPALTGSWRVQTCLPDGVPTLTQLQPGLALGAAALPADARQRYLLWLVDLPLPCTVTGGSRVHHRLLPGRRHMACGLGVLCHWSI